MFKVFSMKFSSHLKLICMFYVNPSDRVYCWRLSFLIMLIERTFAVPLQYSILMLLLWLNVVCFPLAKVLHYFRLTCLCCQRLQDMIDGCLCVLAYV